MLPRSKVGPARPVPPGLKCLITPPVVLLVLNHSDRQKYILSMFSYSPSLQFFGGGGGGGQGVHVRVLVGHTVITVYTTLETSAKHHIPQATNIPYQPLLIKPIFSVLTHAEKQFFSKLVFQCLFIQYTQLFQKRSSHLLCILRAHLAHSKLFR